MGIRNSCGERLRSLSAAVDERIRWFFCGFGKFVAQWPWLCIILPVAISLFLGIYGVGVNFIQEKRAEELYAATGAPSVSDRMFIIKTLGFLPIEDRMLVANKTGGYPNLLEPETIKGNLMELMQMWEKLESMKGNRPFANFKSLCEQAAQGKPCKVQSILAAWNYSMDALEKDPEPLATINTAESSLVDAYGHPFDLSFVLGGIERNEKGQIIAARAFNVRFGIKLAMYPFEKVIFDSMRADGALKDMEKKLRGLEDLLDYNFDPRGFEFSYQVVDEMNDWDEVDNRTLQSTVWNTFEVQRQSDDAIARNLVWVFLCVVLVGCYAHLELFRNSWTYCKAHLVGVSFIAIFMAVASGIGLTLLLGLKFNLVVRSVPFLLVGLGIDDTFIIVGQFQRTDDRLDPGDRIGQTLSRAGASIFVTSLTNLVAFMLAMASRIPALRAFGAFAALGIAFNFIYQVTFFLAFVVLEARREFRSITNSSQFEGEKMPTVPEPSESFGSSARIKTGDQISEIQVVDTDDCCNPQPRDNGLGPHQAPGSISFGTATTNPPKTAHLPKICGGGQFDPNRPTFTQRLFGETIPRAILSASGRATVIVVELALLAIAIYGCIMVRMNFQYRESLSPKGSQLHTAFDIEKEYFFGDQANFGVYTKQGDYFGNQDAMLDALSAVRDSPYVAQIPRPESWYEDYSSWLLNSDHKNELVDLHPPNKTAFMSWLHEYLATQHGSYYLDMIKFNDNGTEIVATKLVNAYSIDLTDGNLAVEMMTSLREVATEKLSELGPMIYRINQSLYDGLRVIKRETMYNVAYAFAAVFAICSITLANVVAAGIVLAMVALTDVMLVGLMWYIGLNFNIVSSIHVLLAVGVAVDYSAHVMHAFLSAQGTRQERAQKALGNIGREVFAGGFTTLLAVIGLAPAASYVLTVFFEMFTAIVVFGLWHGLVVLPVVLMYLGPESYIEEDAKDPGDVEQRR